MEQCPFDDRYELVHSASAQTEKVEITRSAVDVAPNNESCAPGQGEILSLR